MKDQNTKKEKAAKAEVLDVKTMRNQRKGNAYLGYGIGLVVIGTVFLLLTKFVILPRIEDFGKGIGQNAGVFAGTVKGSFEGITQGLSNGYEAGRSQGLSAEDTNVEVNDIKSVGKLEVLVAEDQIVDNFEEGDSYKALFVYKAKATFSVDMSQAEITEEDSILKVLLPELEVEVVIDENETEKMAEWQKFFWSGNREAGYEGYMNSMSKIKEKAAEEMKNSDYLMQQAKDSAIRQVKVLASSAQVEKKQVEIKFKGDGQ